MSEFTKLPAHLSDEEAGKSVKFLQIPPREVHFLAKHNVVLIKDMPLALENGILEDRLLEEWMDFTGCVRSGGTVDWLKYYNSESRVYHHMYFQCAEFDELAHKHPNYPINKATFKKAGMVFHRNSIENFHDLNEFLALGVALRQIE